MVDGDYKFNITLDNTNFELNIKQAKKAFASLVSEAKKAGAEIDNIPNPFDKIGSSAPQVAQATQQFNGLNVATQQLVRELPAATIGLNTFFLAVSNNLPILADQIKQVNEENKRLAKEGKPTVSVLKQIGKSLISWQTALTVGITLLTMYGKDIANWVASLFKGKKGIDAVAEAQKGLNDAIKENGLGIGDEIVKYKELGEAYRKLGEDMAAKKQFIIDNKDAFHDLGVEVQNVADANKVLVEGTPAVIAALTAQASAAAARNLAEKAIEEQITAKINAKNIRGGGSNWWDIVRSGMSYTPFTGVQVAPSYYKEQRAQAEEQRASDAAKLAEEYWKQSKEYAEQANKALKDAGISSTDGTSETERAAELRAEEQRLKQLTDARIRLMNDARRATTEAELAAMQEGLVKKLAQIDYEYDEEERKITERAQQMKALNGGRLSDRDAASIAAMRAANAQKRDTAKNAAWEAELAWGDDTDAEMKAATEALKEELDKRNKAWEDYLIEFGTFKERFKATQDKYSRLIAEAETEGERKALKAERDAALAVFEVQAQGYAQEIADKSIEELNRLAEDLQAQVDAKQAAFDALDSSNSAEAQDYLKTINELKAKIAELKKRIGEASDEVANDNWSGAVLVLQEISNSAQTAASALEEFDSGIAGVLSTIADFASVSANLVGAVKTVIDAAGNALNTALGIIGLIATAVQVVATIISKVAAANKEYKETIENFKALNKELEQMNRLAKINSLEGTIFGDDAFGNFVNNLDVMRDAAKTYSESMDDVAKAEYNRRKAFLELQIAYASKMPDEPHESTPGDAVRKSRTQILDELFAALDELKASELAELSAYESLQQMEVRLSKRKRSTLAEQLPELFENGEITLEGLQKLQQSDVWDKISEDNRDMIDQMIRDWEAYEQATEAVNKYMQDIFGDLGASITDSLVDAFRNGTDAAEAMGNAVGNVVEQIATDMAHAAFIQPLLEQAQDGIEALNKQRSEGGLSDEVYMRELMGITSTLMGNAQDAGEGMAAYLDAMRQMAKEMGIDVFESDSAKNSTHAKGFQTMSQETGSELNGRFTDIQGQTHRIADAVEFMKGLQMQHTQHMQSVSNTLASIHTNTTLIEQHTRELSSISADINVMRRAIDNGAI